MKNVIFTIGHSNHPKEYFLELLQAYQVSVVVDVRSIAASRYNPQYNGKNLKHYLHQHRIEYVHMPEAFGARQTNPAVLDQNGQVDFKKLQETQVFKNGIGSLDFLLSQDQTIALMCAEADPLSCHRFFMIAVYLYQHGYELKHILKDKTVKSQTDLEEELIKKFAKKISNDLFHTNYRETALEKIYRLKNNEMGFIPSN
ncbi:MAG TPA: DUF488 domain-containing protein [Flavobacteriales bacterium]|nr:DUF488 domain-containing protein [Flavobacteriales bacterium]